MAEDRTEESGTETEPEGPAPVRAKRRTRLLIGAGVVLALAVFGILPGIMVTQGFYLDNVSALRAEYRTWSTSTHVDAGCADCHARPGLFGRAVDTVRMSGGFYVSIVMPSRVASTFPEPTNDACLRCHSDLRTVSPTGDLKIPHRAHVDVLKMRCVTCHGYVVHEKSPEGNHRPAMAGCLTCHNGDTAKSSCPTCHTAKDAPASHKSGQWTIAHGHQPSYTACDSCHKWAPHWCADCHTQRPPSHGKDWRTAHGAAVKVHRGCEACHAAPFCIRCHGVVPKLNFDPALKLVR